jgi:hypothetical protein
VSGDLPVGDHEIAQLPPAQKGPGDELRPGVAVYRISLTSDGAVRISAVSSELELSARLRLVLLDEKGVVQAVSVARNWFAARQELTPLALRPQITTDPGFRLNFRGQAGQVFYLRVENYALSEDWVTLYADAFTPNSQGQGEGFTFGIKEGAIEFVGSLTGITWPLPRATCASPTAALWTWWPSSITGPTTPILACWTRW